MLLADETKVEVNCKSELWGALEDKSYRLSRIKLEYMECNFSKTRNKNGVKIEDHEVSKSDHFWYLGSIIHEEWEIEEDVIHRIRAC